MPTASGNICSPWTHPSPFRCSPLHLHQWSGAGEAALEAAGEKAERMEAENGSNMIKHDQISNQI